MTIVESIKCVLQQNNDGLTSKQIYDEIIRQGLYSFGAENPVGVVNAQLRRRCIGLDFPTAYPIKFFEIAGYEGKKIKFRLISTENTATIITAPKTTDISELLPEEKIKAALQEHLQNIRQQVFDSVLNNSPEFFEHLVVDLLLKMGYGYDKNSGIVTGKPHDGGIDGIISEDKLGLDLIYIQAKRFANGNKVTRHDLQAFIGAMEHINKGVFITTSSFTRSAIQFIEKQQQKNIKLIDGNLLADLLVKFLKSIGIDVPAVSVSSLEDVSIQKIHKQIGVISLPPAVRADGTRWNKQKLIQEFGFPVLSKEIARKIELLQNPTPNNKTIRHAIVTGETGEYGGFQKHSKMKLAQKWLEKFGGLENEEEGVNYQIAPFKVSSKCCYYLKEKPCSDWAKEHNCVPYLGLMASEGGRREKSLMLNGCNYFGKGTIRSAPFAIFNRQDLLQLALDLKVPVPEIYGSISGVLSRANIELADDISEKVIYEIASYASHTSQITPILNLSDFDRFELTAKINSLLAYDTNRVKEATDDIKASLKCVKRIRKKMERSSIENYDGYLQMKSDLNEQKSKCTQQLLEVDKVLQQKLIVDEAEFELPVEVKQQLSAGEKQIFIMALYQALSQLNKINVPYIVDTPFARIDKEHRGKILSQFFKKLNGQIIILSTDEEIVGEYRESISDIISNTFVLNHTANGNTEILANTYFGGKHND